MKIIDKKICICADDFGLSDSISEGIIHLAKKKKIQAVSCMVEGYSFNKYFYSLKKLKKNVDIGLHVDLTENSKYINFSYFKILNLLKSIFYILFKKKEISTAFKKQIRIFEKKFKFKPAFIDGHHHIHLFPGILNIIVKNVNLKDILFRNCGDKFFSIMSRNVACIKSLALFLLSKSLILNFKKKGIKYNKSFSGIYYFNEPLEYEILFKRFIKFGSNRHLIMCHPAKLLKNDNFVDKIINFRIKEYNFFNGKKFDKIICKKKIKFSKFSEF